MRNAEQANREVMALPKVGNGIQGMVTKFSNARKVKSLMKQVHEYLDYCYGKDLTATEKKELWKHATNTEKPTFNSVQKRYLEGLKIGSKV